MTQLPNQSGFSLIEILMVVVIVGIITTVGLPSLSKSREAAEKNAIVGVLRTLHNHETIHFSKQGRYARLSELNTHFQNSLGTTSGNRIIRGNYMFLMSPTNPSLTTLQTGYRIIAYQNSGGVFLPTFSIDEDGVIDRLVP